ncbi:hypothetical protein FG05_35251 [Fusarium graminearum]|nr:hypothetical protein FG05_35251 [Fusarium graminearum]
MACLDIYVLLSASLKGYQGLFYLPVTHYAYCKINLRLIALPIVVLLQPIVADDLFWPIHGGKYYEFLCEVVKGFISGLEIPCVVAIVWTWFTLEELPLVLLALTLTGEKFLVLASGSPIHQWYPYLMTARQTMQRRLIRYLLVFVLSAITKFDVHRNYVAGYTDGFGVLVLMMIIGTILLKFQQASFIWSFTISHSSTITEVVGGLFTCSFQDVSSTTSSPFVFQII